MSEQSKTTLGDIALYVYAAKCADIETALAEKTREVKEWKAIAERLAVELAYLGAMFPLPTSAENALSDFEELGKESE